MGLSLKISNSLESLATGLAENLAATPGRIFEPDYIVTQTDGMNNWLKLQLAARLGISANQRFLTPSDFIRQLYFLLNGSFSETLSRETLSWLLFRLLDEDEFVQRFPQVAEYYRADKSAVDLRRKALADEVADLFDQYSIYRPEIIHQWTHADSNALPAETWQQYLWTRARDAANEELPDKSALASYILDRLQEETHQKHLLHKLPSVHLFGLSILSAYHIQLLYELSKVVDVYFHLLNPAPSVYWLDDLSEKQLAVWKRKERSTAGAGIGNALLTSWGRVIRDTMGLLFRHDEFLNAYEETELLPPTPDSLLHKLQLDIFNAAASSRQPLTDRDINDGSLQISSCHTIAREVECLYNYLVHLVDKRQEALSPRDIVVLISDIDSYAPYIKAVFNHAPYPFQYTIADESYSDGDNLFTALHTILSLDEENFTAEAVLQLLDSSYIRRRFDIADPDRIREVVGSAGIRFGIEGNKDDDTYLVGWVYGLRRIMYGICISGGEKYGEAADAFYPLDIVEGGEATAIIRFCHFVEVLMSFIRGRKADRPITEWVSYIESLVQNLVFEPGEEPDEHFELLIRQLSTLNMAGEYMSAPISFEVFSRSLLDGLDGTTRAGLFAGGGITFCSLIPMRSIPFRVVAMLGLDYDKFPRREVPVSFSLIQQSPRPGDRNKKENDKHLFLETLLSAKDYLYLSYLGQNPSDNALLPPSALIDELLDYIEAGAQSSDAVRGRLVTRHPLQNFSRQYTPGNDRLYNYLDNNRAPAPPRTLLDKCIEPLNFEEIPLDHLLSFFRNPFKAYYNKVLGIYYDEDQTLLPETELFGLDNLQTWTLKQQLLPMSGPEALEERLLKTGQLPLKNIGTVILHGIDEQVAPVRQVYREYTANKEEQNLPFDLQLGASRITGILEPVFDGLLLQVCWSKHPTKYLIDAYIRYLAGASSGLISRLSFLSTTGTPTLYEAVPLSVDEARRRLESLISIYKEGFRQIAPWYPSFHFKPIEVDSLTIETFLSMVDRSLNNSYRPCEDPYIMPEYHRGFFAQDGVAESFRSVYLNIYVPLYQLFPDFMNEIKG